MGDVRLDLEELDDTIAPPMMRAARVERRGSSRVAWSVTGVSLIMAVILGLLWLRGGRSAVATDPVALSVVLPSGISFSSSSFRPMVSLSPDGKEMVISAVEDGKARLYRRRLDSPDLEALEGTEYANAPFHSPDGRWVGFTSQRDERLMKLSLDSGQIVRLADRTHGVAGVGETTVRSSTPRHTPTVCGGFRPLAATPES